MRGMRLDDQPGQPAASAAAVSPHLRRRKRGGKLLEPKTATGPMPILRSRRSGRGERLALRQSRCRCAHPASRPGAAVAANRRNWPVVRSRSVSMRGFAQAGFCRQARCNNASPKACGYLAGDGFKKLAARTSALVTLTVRVSKRSGRERAGLLDFRGSGLAESGDRAAAPVAGIDRVETRQARLLAEFAADERIA